MKAAVTTKIGPPEVIEIQERDKPTPKEGEVLIKIKAFGLNRSEMYTRQGHSPNVKFPRIQGIECVGMVEHDTTGKYKPGQQVAAIMGEMGREFDGGYAEYTVVPSRIVFAFNSSLPWEKLGAIPEMYQTVSGSLHEALEVRKGEILLIRGGTSSIGMLTCQLAKHLGLTVMATTRNESKSQILIDNGADHVVIDDGKIQEKVKAIFPAGVNKVLELVGTVTLKDSLYCLAPKGICCMTGILGNSWSMPEFTPMGDIPSTRKLTAYMGDAENLSSESLQEFIDAVESGAISLNIDRVLTIDQVPEAHEIMEASKAKGKLVVVT